MNLNDLETFILVAETGTFSEAGERLGVPTSTVSRRVSRLEEELGVALLQRSARSIALSEDGRALAERCAPPIRELARIERGLGDAPDAVRGKLRITTSIDFGSSAFFTQLVADYATTFEEVELEVEVANRLVDLLEEGFDVAFRSHAGALADRDDLVVRRLGALPMHLYASPAYIARSGTLDTFEALADHTVVDHGVANRDRWPARRSVIANDYGPLASIIAGGAGVGSLPDFVAAPFVSAGSLVRIDIERQLPSASLSLVWLRSRHLAPRVRAFIDLAVERAKNAEWLATSP